MKTSDGGNTWTTLAITAGTGDKDIRPVVPLNRPADTEMVMWISGDYSHWDATVGDGFDTSVMLWTNTVPEPGMLGIALLPFAFLARRDRH